MKTVSKLFVSLLLLIGLSLSAYSATQTLTILGGYGTQGDESTYTEYSRDGGNTWHKAYLTGWHPWGFAPGTNSWINFDPSPFVGLYTTTDYRVRFYVPADFSDPSMNFLVKADNEAWIAINGINFAHISGSNSGSAGDALLNSALTAGLNEITIKLRDYGGWVGLNYRIDIQMESDEPLTLQPAGEPVVVDADGDGLPSNIDPDDNNPDIDGDGIPDGTEVENGTNPLSSDTDNDGVSDNVDVNPLSPDSDGDGVGDFYDQSHMFVGGAITLNGVAIALDDFADENGINLTVKLNICKDEAKNHGKFVSCVSHLLTDIGVHPKGKVLREFAKANKDELTISAVVVPVEIIEVEVPEL